MADLLHLHTLPAPEPEPTVGDGFRAYGPAVERLSFSLVTRSRGALVVVLSAEPVFDLTRRTMVGQRLRRAVAPTRRFGLLSGWTRRTPDPADQKRIDIKTQHRGAELLRLDGDAVGVMPVFWRTASTVSGRFALNALAPRSSAQASLLYELTGGVETAAIASLCEALDAMEERGRGVILNVAPDVRAIRRLAPARAEGLTLDFTGLRHHTARDWDAACRLIEAAAQGTTRVVVLNLSPDRGEAAAAVGATHAVLSALRPIRV